MENYEETLSSAIADAQYYGTDMNAIYGSEIIGVETKKAFTPEQIARYSLPEFMAWYTGGRAQYDVSGREYIGFNSLEEMTDYINNEAPLIDDED